MINWIHLAQDRDNWWPLVNISMISRYHKSQEISRLAEKLSASQGRLSTI
jgi:hypothetical protein